MADFKAVDLQMALPRLSDASIQQQQQSHKIAADQQWLADQGIRQADAEKRQAVRPEKPAGPAVRERQRQGGGGDNRGRFSGNRRGDGDATAEAPHPYKGKHIDRRL